MARSFSAGIIFLPLGQVLFQPGILDPGAVDAKQYTQPRKLGTVIHMGKSIDPAPGIIFNLVTHTVNHP